MLINARLVQIVKDNRFYSSLYEGRDLEKFGLLPTIDRSLVNEHYDEICPDKDDTFSIATSGTTGQPLLVRWTNRDYIVSNMYTWNLRKKWYDITPTNRFCTFHVDTEYGMQDITILNGGRTLSLGKYNYSEHTLEKYVKAINEFETEWILGPVSLVYILLKKCISMKEQFHSLRYIELNGEYVSPEMYEEIVRLSKVAVGNLYGATEFNGIAMRCPCGKMHILEHNVHVENDKVGQVSDIIITGLVNTRMPLIRYNIGDIGLVIENEECACGVKGKCLDITYGRRTEIIGFESKEMINASIFSSLIYKLNLEKKIALQYCVDVRNQKYVLQILVKDGYLEYAKRQKAWMKRELLRFDIDYDVELYTKIEEILSENGKFVFCKKHNDESI